MGNPVARQGDFVKNDADVHPWAGTVPVVGIITNVSSNVLCNSLGVAIADPSKKSPHAACTGTNDFAVQSGSPKVLVNGFQLGRSGDPTIHCGGVGSILPFCSLNTLA